MRGWGRLILSNTVALAALATAASARAEPMPLPADHPAAKQQAEKLDKLPPVPPVHGLRVDRSGRTEKGRASFYGPHFANKKMADGHRMNPNTNVAASKQLPLGSVAKVKNLNNGKTATVKVEDRGPYVDGRVVDLTPKVANELDINKKKGVAPVEVKPITLPAPDGEVKLGAGAAEASPQEVQKAVETTRSLTGGRTETEASR